MGFFSGFWGSLKGFFTGGSAGSYDAGVSGSRLYVGNLSYRVKDEELRALFSKYGRVKTLHLIRDRMTRRLKGYAFLEMSPDDARKSLALSGTEFLGRKIVVSIANSKEQKSSPPRRHSGGSSSGGSSSGGNRFRRRRSGPRVYGQTDSAGSSEPVERLE